MTRGSESARANLGPHSTVQIPAMAKVVETEYYYDFWYEYFRWVIPNKTGIIAHEGSQQGDPKQSELINDVRTIYPGVGEVWSIGCICPRLSASLVQVTEPSMTNALTHHLGPITHGVDSYYYFKADKKITTYALSMDTEKLMDKLPPWNWWN